MDMNDKKTIYKNLKKTNLFWILMILFESMRKSKIKFPFTNKILFHKNKIIYYETFFKTL